MVDLLGRDDNSVNLGRLDRALSLLLVLDGHLSLAIRTQPSEIAILADICEFLICKAS